MIITKKVCTHIIKKAKSLISQLLLDPKNKDFKIYKNATMITPNQHEALK